MSSFTTFPPVVIQQRFWAQHVSSSSLVAAPCADVHAHVYRRCQATPPLWFPPPSFAVPHHPRLSLLDLSFFNGSPVFHAADLDLESFPFRFLLATTSCSDHAFPLRFPPPPSGNFDTYPMQRFRFPNAAILQLLPPSSQQHSLTLSAVAPSSLRSCPRLSSPPIPLQSLLLRHLALAVIVVRISELVSLFRDLLVPISRTSCLGVDTYRASFSALSPGVPPTSSFHHSGDPVTCTFIHTILLPFLALGTSTRAPFHLELYV
ncbi:hypothetical protein C8R45DRAFT_1029294 [Mycena sanguinolenta]|nr:hypothetical protein C8R45DRAFT_1029294 [Mycena sanguinolenta]